MRISRNYFANFVAELRTTFVRVSHECRGNFHVSRTSRELVAKVLNMFKNFMRIFSPKYLAGLSRDCLATVARRSCECREPVAAKFWRIYNAKFSRHSCECRASVARRSCDSLEKTCENLATIWRENKTKRHSYECLSTLARMSRDCRTN